MTATMATGDNGAGAAPRARWPELIADHRSDGLTEASSTSGSTSSTSGDRQIAHAADAAVYVVTADKAPRRGHARGEADDAEAGGAEARPTEARRGHARHPKRPEQAKTPQTKQGTDGAATSRARAPNRTSRTSRARSTGSRRSTSRTCRRSMVDGVDGPATKKRLRRVKYYLGYRGAEQRSASFTPELLKHMDHPRSPRHAESGEALPRAARRRKQHKLAQGARPASPAGVPAQSRRIVKPVARQRWMKPLPGLGAGTRLAGHAQQRVSHSGVLGASPRAWAAECASAAAPTARMESSRGRSRSASSCPWSGSGHVNAYSRRSSDYLLIYRTGSLLEHRQ